ncbi:exopolysaccharide Pel transporter PelG [Magnetofaba australis]|uniref:Transmembrane protein n=1 Tax=Magnetofaba australis IT-1 TaxID=1434232 RepID=A0A1Y2K8C2_9PROT|nr:exopolysaccharide Pel transporter PelG [Magnetofaba australis]OSM04916.1 hypothetical protein MAIT1_03023 [Magnetofaba australis IT-1]
MAGIGFNLRKLTDRDDFLGGLMAYGYSALISSGPWIFTIVALTGTLFFGSFFVDFNKQAAFRIIIIYNFAFSLLLSGPVVMICTRWLADQIYKKDVTGVPGMLIAALGLLFITNMFLVIPFYLFATDLDLVVRFMAIANYFLITGIWLVGVFLTALKDYHPIIRAFAFGMAIGLGCVLMLAGKFGVAGMLAGFNFGLAYILFALLARILAEYPYPARRPFAFMRYFKRYWELALGGFVANMAAWIDKFIMWFSPHREVVAGNMIHFPNYDGAMFLAYLTIIPSMAAFVVTIETSFFERYVRFYQDISEHAPRSRIMRNHQSLLDTVQEQGRNFLILQGAFTLMVISMAPTIFEWLGINYLQMGIFRLGVLGAFFHVMSLFLFITLSYFDFRKPTLYLQLTFLVSNCVFTLISMNYGYQFYGYGYFLATVVTFLATFFTTIYLINELPYQTFVKQNASVSSAPE